MTPLPKGRGGRTFTAVERGLLPDLVVDGVTFTEGDTVRLSGLIGPRFTVLGFRADDGSAELYPTGTNASGGQRTVKAALLRKVRGS